MRSHGRPLVPVKTFALGTFAVGTNASVIAGVLPGVAADLRADIELAGQLVTAFAIAHAVLAPILAVLTASWEQRRVLAAALGVFVLGNALSAMAPAYGWVLAARVVAAAGAALFTPSALAAVAALSCPRDRPRMMSLTLLGFTLAATIGAPAGAVLGSIAGWRGAMWFVVVLGVVAAVAVNFAVMPLSGGTFAGAVVATAVYGFAGWSVAVPQQQNLIECAPTGQALVLSLNSSVRYLAISLGAASGGAIVHFSGADQVPLFSAMLAASGLVLAEVFHRTRNRYSSQGKTGESSSSPQL